MPKAKAKSAILERLLPGWQALDSARPQASVIALVGSNAVPLLGVLFAGWRVFPVMLLYSLENIVVGFYNVLRMSRAPCDLAELRRTSKGINDKRGLIAFFCVHYGMFVFVHLIFVFALFGFGLVDGIAGSGAPSPAAYILVLASASTVL